MVGKGEQVEKDQAAVPQRRNLKRCYEKEGTSRKSGEAQLGRTEWSWDPQPEKKERWSCPPRLPTDRIETVREDPAGLPPVVQ